MMVMMMMMMMIGVMVMLCDKGLGEHCKDDDDDDDDDDEDDESCRVCASVDLAKYTRQLFTA
eukprot:9411520-Karenia_brevis.AAC.1